jgi:hypothetical protein
MIRLSVALAAIVWTVVVLALAVPLLPTPQEAGRLRQTAHVDCFAGTWCQ